MAGRGRGATLPAWLTAAENNGNDFTSQSLSISSNNYNNNNNNISQHMINNNHLPQQQQQQQQQQYMNHISMPIDNNSLKSNINNQNNPEFIGRYEEYMQSNHTDHNNNSIVTSSVGFGGGGGGVGISIMNSNSNNRHDIHNHSNSRDNNIIDNVRDGNKRSAGGGGHKRSSSRSM